MRIEEHWDDGFLYYVEFLVKQDTTFRIISKHIVLYAEMEKNEISEIIKKKFGNVICVKTIEYYEDILLIKE